MYQTCTIRLSVDEQLGWSHFAGVNRAAETTRCKPLLRDGVPWVYVGSEVEGRMVVLLVIVCEIFELISTMAVLICAPLPVNVGFLPASICCQIC